MKDGLCGCGCGKRTKLAVETCRARGQIKGQPLRFLHGHNTRKPLDQRYEIDPATGCWLWLGSVDSRTGYGNLRLVQGGEARTLRAHRWVYEELVGPIPAGSDLDHVRARGCRYRHCVNPAHLEPVTRAENLRRGMRTKLRRTDVFLIRESSVPAPELAPLFGVHKSTISNIRSGRTWRPDEVVA